MSTATTAIESGLSELFDSLRTLLGTIPAEADAKRQEYQGLLLALAADVATGKVSIDEAKESLRAARLGLTQAIGSIGIDLFGKRQAAMQTTIETALTVLLKVATVLVAA